MSARKKKPAPYAEELGLQAFVARGKAAQEAVNALGAGERTAARKLADYVVEVEERLLAPHSTAQGDVEVPGKVWEAIVDLARRVPR